MWGWRLLQTSAYSAVLVSSQVWHWAIPRGFVHLTCLLGAIFATATVNFCIDFRLAPRTTKIRRILALSVILAAIGWELIWHEIGSVPAAAFIGFMLMVFLALIVEATSRLIAWLRRSSRDATVQTALPAGGIRKLLLDEEGPTSIFW